ncbi:MAG: hypothetical protein HY905_17285 [Deltaproteobacteria bacterium]|nr:hypothetical protein [Deltaproteobacteria bacterium]
MTPTSLLLLGWSGFKALVKRPFKAPHALERVLRRGAAERLVSLEASGPAAVRRSSACLACGRCDEVSGAAGGTASPADWVLAGLRDLTDRDLAAGAPGDAQRLERMEAACPVRVPFRELARQAAAMRDAISSL